MGACTRRISADSIGTKATSLGTDRSVPAAWCMPSPRARLTHIKPLVWSKGSRLRLGRLVVLSVWSSGVSGAATVGQTDIRGSGRHDWDPSGAASSRVAGHPMRVPHRGFGGSPCGRTHPLLRAERLAGFQAVRSGCSVALAPDEAGELARAGDDDLLLGFAAAGHPLPALVEPLLAAPAALNHDGVLAALAAREFVADLRPTPCVPGRLDQQPADVAVADLGDRALPSLLTAGGVRGHQADERHELLGGGEAVEVADLGHQCGRCHRFHPRQTTQPNDQPTPRLLLPGLADRTLQLPDPPVDEADPMPRPAQGDPLGR